MPRNQLFLAAASFELAAEAATRIQLLPYGEFRAIDGRPADAPAWYLTEENGHDVAALANSSINRLVIDYEHQTLNKEKNGQPAPAAGWMRWFEFTPQGLFADAQWTDKAGQMIAGKEYRYISAVFAYDTLGYVRKIYHAALTNYPGIDGMAEVLAAASAQFLPPSPQEGAPMKLAELLRQVFDTPDATEAQLEAALTALVAKKPATVALSAVFDELQSRDTRIAALTAQAARPDPAQFVPVATMQEMQQQISALTAQISGDKADTLIQAALSAGKLLPAQKDWAHSLAKQDNGAAMLAAYLDTVIPVAALSASQTDGKDLGGTKVAALTAEEKAAAKMLGMSDADFIASVKPKQEPK